jgi:hypothetical protein
LTLLASNSPQPKFEYVLAILIRMSCLLHIACISYMD